MISYAFDFWKLNLLMEVNISHNCGMSGVKRCIFCGNHGGNEEHIVPKWIVRDLGLYNLKTRIGFGVQRASGEMDEIQAPQPLGAFVTDAVCETCNNKWMSQLENKVKPLLTPLLHEQWPADDRPLFQALFLHSGLITQWLLKTACAFGEKMSVQIPVDIRTALYRKQITSEVMADLSYNTECGLYVGMSRSWNCYKDEKIEPRQIENRSFRFVWQLRHLAMRIAYFPGCEKMMTRPNYPVRLYPKFGISPDYHSDGLNKRSYHYDTLEQLEHDTTYALR
jgi:hypothetical protein